jgi:hypothetical protein
MGLSTRNSQRGHSSVDEFESPCYCVVITIYQKVPDYAVNNHTVDDEHRGIVVSRWASIVFTTGTVKNVRVLLYIGKLEVLLPPRAGS